MGVAAEKGHGHGFAVVGPSLPGYHPPGFTRGSQIMRGVRCLSKFAAAGSLALFLSLGGDRAEALYDVSPGEIPGKPGTIIRIWPLEGGGPGMGGNGEAFRILYRSTSPSGKPIPVSGAIFIPSGPAPAGGRNIIAWAHPTSGVVPPCAPSLMPDVGGMMWNLGNMIGAGYIVVATDYPGLGTDGIHPYLIGESEARAVLDSVRAARDMPNTGASNRFAVWGHSQGGQAALYTGEIAARYAPELKLVRRRRGSAGDLSRRHCSTTMRRPRRIWWRCRCCPGRG